MEYDESNISENSVSIFMFRLLVVPGPEVQLDDVGCPQQQEQQREHGVRHDGSHSSHVFSPVERGVVNNWVSGGCWRYNSFFLRGFMIVGFTVMVFDA